MSFLVYAIFSFQFRIIWLFCNIQKLIWLIYYKWKNIREQYNKNKFKIIAWTWNYEFELPNGSCSVSDIQNYIEYIIEKYEILTTIPPIHV